MRLTTTAILAGLMLGGAAYAQTAPSPSPARPPAASPAPSAAPSQPAAPVMPDRPAAAAAGTFAVGDVVELKSGSPHMTVIDVGADIQVLWYTSDKGLQRERFPAAALEKTDLNEPDEYAPNQGRSEQPMQQPRRDDDMQRGMDHRSDDRRMMHMRWRERMDDDRRYGDRRYDDHGRNRRHDDDDDDRYDRR